MDEAFEGKQSITEQQNSSAVYSVDKFTNLRERMAYPNSETHNESFRDAEELIRNHLNNSLGSKLETTETADLRNYDKSAPASCPRTDYDKMMTDANKMKQFGQHRKEHVLGSDPVKNLIGVIEKQTSGRGRIEEKSDSGYRNVTRLSTPQTFDKEAVDGHVKGILESSYLGQQGVARWHKEISKLSGSVLSYENSASGENPLKSEELKHSAAVNDELKQYIQVPENMMMKQKLYAHNKSENHETNRNVHTENVSFSSKIDSGENVRMKNEDAQKTVGANRNEASHQSSISEEKEVGSGTDMSYEEMSDYEEDREERYEVDEEMTAALNTEKQTDDGDETDEYIPENCDEKVSDKETGQEVLSKQPDQNHTEPPKPGSVKEEAGGGNQGDDKLPGITGSESRAQKEIKKVKDMSAQQTANDADDEEPPPHLQSMYMHIPLRNDAADANKPHRCPLCNRGFKRASHVRRHMTIHTGEKKFKCDTCGKHFTTMHYLKLHDRLHTGEKPHVCEICDRAFTHYSNFRIHLRSHTNERPYPCTICGRSYTGSSHLKRHMRTHTGEKPHKCEICLKEFAQPSQVRSHMFSHTGLKPFACNVCDKKFTQAHVLGKHMLQHAFEVYNKEVNEKSEKEEKEQTDETDKKTAAKFTSRKQQKCKICHEDFSEKSTLKTHMLIHMGQKPYVCSFCEKQFIELTNLKQHMFVHTGEKPFSCDVCGKEFTQQSNLKSHKRVHTGERPYKCEVCNKDFAHSSSLKNHMLFHTGETRHHCQTCGKGFTDTSSLKKHVRTHTGEKPYKCTYCGRGFAASSSLKTHVFTHGGARPYKCDQCPKQFARPSQLEKHLLEKHKIERTVESVFNKPNFDHSNDSLAKPILGQSIKEVMEGIKESKANQPMDIENTTESNINEALVNLNPLIERAIEAVDRKIIQEQTALTMTDIEKSKSTGDTSGNVGRKMMLEQTAMPLGEMVPENVTDESTDDEYVSEEMVSN